MPKKDEIWLDVDKGDIDGLVNHIKRYALRKKIEFNDISQSVSVFALWDYHLEID